MARTEILAPPRSTRLAGRLTESVDVETVFLGLFIVALAWVPFWLGSNQVLPWAINAIVFPSLAAAYTVSLVVRGMPQPMPLRSIRLPALLFAAAAAWAVFQNATWTPAGLHHPVWQVAADVLGRPIPGSISVDRDLTALALLRLMTAASVLWLALQLCRGARRAEIFLWALVGIGGLYAAAGIYAVAFLPGGVLFDEIAPDRVVSSTFVNRNNFATFAGLGLIVALALTMRLYRRELRESGDVLRLKIAALIGTTGGTAALPLAVAFTILVALLLSGSRGGIIATAVGLLTLLALNVLSNRRTGRHEAAIALLVAVLIGAAFIAFGGVVLGRIAGQGLYDEGRLLAQVITIRSILSAPILGYGYGAFASAFPMFRDDTISVWSAWDKLHETYLEVLQGLGLVFGTMLIASVVLLVFRCVRAAVAGRRAFTIPAAAASVSFLVGAHALVDFSLQIQAVTLTYMAVLGAGVAQSIEV